MRAWLVFLQFSIILLVAATATMARHARAFAQLSGSDAQDLRFDRVTTEDGLSHNGAFAVVQDRVGFLWIGTVDGLNRYDGHEFKIYKSDKDWRLDNSVILLLTPLEAWAKSMS